MRNRASFYKNLKPAFCGIILKSHTPYEEPMSNLKFFLFSIPLATGIILISLYLLPLAWSLGVFSLTAILLVLFFISAKSAGGSSAGGARPAISAEVSENELESILNNFGDALIIYDENFKILFFNTASERLFMVTSAEVSGMAIQPEAMDNPKLRLLTQAVFPTLAPVLRSS